MPTKTDPSAPAAVTVKRKITRKSAGAAASVASSASPAEVVSTASKDTVSTTSEQRQQQQPAAERGSVDSIRRAFYIEEEGVGSCPTTADATSSSIDDGPLVAFAATKARLLSRLSEIAQLKSSIVKHEGDSLAIRLENLRIGCMSDLMIMKRLNREAQFRLKRARELTASSKLQADSRHLQLQNLLYECRHLQREITRCQDFRSRHESISLAPLDEFVRDSGANLAELSEHECTLARLRYELKQRETLANKLRTGKRQAAAVQADIAEKRRRLESLAPLLEAVAKAAEPVETALGLNSSGPGASVTAQWKADAVAKLLPAPLYLLYSQLSAYADSGCLDNSEELANQPTAMLVEIIGDRNEAASVRQAELDRLKSAVSKGSSAKAGQDVAEAEDGRHADANGDEEDDDDDEEDLSSKKKKKNKKKSKKKSKAKSGKSAAATANDDDDDDEAGNESGEEVIRQLLTPHPLSVRLSLSVPNASGRRLLLSFHYLPSCRLVTVRNVSIEPQQQQQQPPVDIVDVDTAKIGGNSPLLLDCLYPGDDGRTAPGYAVRHALPGAASDFLWLRRRDVGLAYTWAQRLAGIVCRSVDLGNKAASPDIVLDSELAFRGVADCVRRLRGRAESRLQLLNRLDNLANAGVNFVVKATPGLPPVANCSICRPWQRVTYDAFCELAFTARLSQLISPVDLFFNVGIRWASGDQKAVAAVAVCIPVDYPDRLPVFGVGVEEADPAGSVAMTTCAQDLDLHEIETEINVYPTDLLPTAATRSDVLPLQFYRLLLALEVYFNTEAVGHAGSYRRPAASSATTRGLPSRVRPFRYSTNGDGFVHRQ